MTVEQRRISVVVLALAASFLVYADSTIVNLTLTRLTGDLGATRAELEWTINAYTLGFGAAMLGAGALTDALGARRAFVAGLVVLTAASAACAAAPTMLVLDVSRAVQGVGAALLLPSSLVLATSTAADEHARHRALGWWAAAGGIGMAAGPLLGGLLVSALDWRAVFGVNVVVGLPAVVVALRVVPDLARRPRRADVRGMAAATLLIGGLVFGLIEAPAQGWSAPGVLVALGLAVAGLAAFVHTARTSAAPLLPAAVYADRGFGSSAVQGVLLNFTFYGLLFGLSLTLQQGRGLDAVTTGLLFLPLTGLISLGNLRAAAASRRFGRGAVVATGQAGLAVSLVAVALTSRAEAEWPLVLALLPVGLTAGLVVPTLTAQSLAAVPVALHGAASAVFNSSRQVGAAVGVAVFGPLLGTGRALHDGFERCVLMGAGAILVSLLVGLAVGSGGRLRGGGYARES